MALPLDPVAPAGCRRAGGSAAVFEEGSKPDPGQHRRAVDARQSKRIPVHPLDRSDRMTDDNLSLRRRDFLKLSAAGLLSGVSVPWFESLAQAASVKRPRGKACI